jgi:S1-C subfamily serine protease
VEGATDLQRLMVAELIGTPTPLRLVRAGVVRTVTVTPAELDL